MLQVLLLAMVLQSRSVFSEGVFPTLQAQYSWPLRLGGELGASFYEPHGFLTSAGPFASVSAGRDGMGLNAGLKGALFMFLPYSTASLAASGLYLWDEPETTYAGLRGSCSFTLITVFGGAYRRLSGDRSEDWLFSLGAGLGMP